jgi:UDP-N-acetylmuramoyl-tripeptide--D-alanyl-D-alanine ligase
MAELGEFGERLHRQVGALALEHGVRRLYAIGPLTKSAVRAFGKGAAHFKNIDALMRHLKKDLHSEAYVLVKGSRAMHMERVVAGLLAGEQSADIQEERENAA